MRCVCGREHPAGQTKLFWGQAILASSPAAIWQDAEKATESVYLLCDENTYPAAGKTVEAALCAAGAQVHTHLLPHPAPAEAAVGSAALHFPADAGFLVVCGSGVLNDIGKMLAMLRRCPYLLVATAPSMDGFVSATASMERDGLKVTLPARTADWILADLDVLAAAPRLARQSGVGDMFAKIISLPEWHIASRLVGEPYCPVIAGEVAEAVRRMETCAAEICAPAAKPAAVRQCMEGLVLAGDAMRRAGLSRPASGMEHYISHIWDMRALYAGTASSTHGVQCAVGVYMTLCSYAALGAYLDSHSIAEMRRRGEAHAAAFDLAAWQDTLRTRLGAGAETMIALETREGKYDPVSRRARMERFFADLPWYRARIAALPTPEAFAARLRALGMPVTPADIGISDADALFAMAAARDIRDKYVLARLLWDLGLPDGYGFAAL